MVPYKYQREQLSTLASSQVSLRDRGCWSTAYLGSHKTRLNKIKLSVLQLLPSLYEDTESI